jgi:molybdopterin synthase catalytic subunit
MVELTDDPIDIQQVLQRVQSPLAGATVLFVGTTRQFTRGRETLSLDYECYPTMAEAKLAELESEARQRWQLTQLCIVHRLGRVGLSEASVAIAVSAPHREAAFEAGKWLIDTLKTVVPIWKQEHWSDGTSQWVHPGIDPPDARPASEPDHEQPGHQ